jgi:hypothetical protein
MHSYTLHQLQHQTYTDIADQEASLQAVIVLLQAEVQTKITHCKKVGIFPSDSMSEDEDEWMLIANHKYFDRAASLKEQEGGSSLDMLLMLPLY